jgi:hypothetical protein
LIKTGAEEKGKEEKTQRKHIMKMKAERENEDGWRN